MENVERDARKTARIINQIIKEKEAFAKPVNDFKKAYESLEIGPYNDEVLKIVRDNGFDSIAAAFKKKVDEDIYNSGIKLIRLKEVLSQAYSDGVTDLLLAFDNLLSSSDKINKDNELEKFKKSALRIEGLGLKKLWASDGDLVTGSKRLEIGRGSWISTKCKKSWNLSYGLLNFRQVDGDVYIYAECPLNQHEEGRLVAHSQPMPNTSEHYMILVQGGSYQSINFE